MADDSVIQPVQDICCLFNMKNFIFVGFVFQFCICNPGTALYSLEELKIYNFFFEPYGIIFRSDLILNTSPDFSNCTDQKEAYENCRTIASSLHDEKLQNLSNICPRSSYSCLHNYTNNSHPEFRTWLRKVQTTVENLCKNHCWKTMQLITKKCILTGKSMIKVMRWQ